MTPFPHGLRTVSVYSLGKSESLVKQISGFGMTEMWLISPH